MLRFIPGSFVPRLTGLVFALAILAALGVGAFSPRAAQHAQAGPPQFEQRALAPLGGGWTWSSSSTCSYHVYVTVSGITQVSCG